MLREQLLAELKDIASAEDAAIWAHRILGSKNSLTAADARKIEDAFQARLIILGGTAETRKLSMRRYRRSHPKLTPVRIRARSTGRATGFQRRSTRAAWPIPEPRRFRDKDHVKFVAKQPCLICGRQAIGWASSALRPAPCPRPQGER